MPQPALAGGKWGCIAAYRRKREVITLFSFKYFRHRHHLHKVEIQSWVKNAPARDPRSLLACTSAYQFLV